MQETRKVMCELSFLSQSDGSVKLKHGRTSVIVAVNGPLEVKIVKEQVDKMNVEVTFKGKTDSKIKNQKCLEKIVHQLCESLVLIKNFPRTNLAVAVQELEDDGSLTACIINATCMALMDACVPLKQMFAAVNICHNETDDVIILDPTMNQESEHPSVMFVFSSDKSSIVAVHSNAFFNETILNRCLLTAKEHVVTIFDMYRDHIKQLHHFS